MKYKIVLSMICFFTLYGTAQADPRTQQCTDSGGQWNAGFGACIYAPGTMDCGGKPAFAGQTCSCGAGGCTVTGQRSAHAVRPTESAKPVNDLELLNGVQRAVVSGNANTPTGTLDNQGEIDGVYDCNVTLTSGGVTGAPFNATISVNGHADGSEVMTIQATKVSNPQFYGYGSGMVGDIDAVTFHGTNSFKQPFSLTSAYASSTGGAALDQLTLTGTYAISATQTANLACTAK
jgi:hypothetical protein